MARPHIRRSLVTAAMTMTLAVTSLILAPAANAGRVDFTRCGGTGTVRDVMVSNAEGPVADLNPGTPYTVEIGMIPSAAAQYLHLRVTATYLGFPITIIDQELPNSSAQPGVPITVTFTLTPNDILKGNTLPVRMEVSNPNGFVETCSSIQVHVQ
jgi:hypothetical protein